jgi:predicted component of type VI protein secretion system
MLRLHRYVSLLALALALTACKRPPAPKPSTDTPLALLARPLINGGELDVASLAGKVVLVNFWSPG